MTPTIYTFNGYRLVPEQRLLLSADGPVKLGGRTFDMLVALVEGGGRTLSKAELFDKVWPKLVVEDNNLQVQILALRKLLGHPAVMTIPGRGYRFALPLEVEEGAAQEAAAAEIASERAAVVPATAGRRTNLSDRPPTRLYGRDEDLRRLQELLVEHEVVTVAGPGGIGKTRLADCVARERLKGEVDDVWWVDLSPLSDPSLLPMTVARAMGVSLEGARDATQTVVAKLRGRAALLVLDNGEHLLAGVTAFVTAVRESASTVRLLITSQEVLRVIEENVLRLGPLTLPAADDSSAMDASGAVALFAARAGAADRRFRLDDSNRASVAEICRRLDGIPLAIELAAARVPLLGVHGLRERLDERFHVLTAGTRAVMRRHQTLRAALDWSLALLSPPERAVFRRLGVFVGGFGLDAAQDVAQNDDIDRWDVLEHLGALVDKSLVVAEDTKVPRYRLLETTRLRALELLAEVNETDAVLLLHAQSYLAFAQRHRKDVMERGEAAEAWRQFDLERENLLHAIAWCCTTGEDERATVAISLVVALDRYWPARGLWAIGLQVTLKALSRAGHLPLDERRLEAMTAASWMLAVKNETAQADVIANQVLEAARDLGDRKAESNAHRLLGHTAVTLGRLDEGEQHFRTAIAVGEAAGLERIVNNATIGLLRALWARGNRAEAERTVESLLPALRKEGNGYNIALGLIGSLDLCFVKLLRGCFAAALVFSTRRSSKSSRSCLLDRGRGSLASSSTAALQPKWNALGLPWTTTTSSDVGTISRPPRAPSVMRATMQPAMRGRSWT